ncbi:hypothetical protein [Dokdonia sp.]|uniref:hypothetical protein n=1 Tax=Dokdonia sp. TaxID=2024995 RepID=UPI003263FB9A
MDDINIDFKVSKQEGAIIVGALMNFYKNSNNRTTKESLGRIIQDIERDLRINDLIFGRLVTGIRPVVRGPIRRNSDIAFDLGLTIGYRNTSLRGIANNILLQLLNKFKPTQKTKQLTRKQIVSCQQISHLITLIKNSFDAAR